MIDLEAMIAVIWIGGVGAAGVITSLIFSSEKYRKWSVEKIGVVSLLLSALVVACILMIILCY